jgi:uncharacterized membrane protein YhaH (DUF805 family)
MRWFLLSLRRYSQLTGRSRRREFWLFHLILAAIQIAAGALDAALAMDRLVLDLWGPLTLLVLVLFLTPSLSVSVRRLHDTGRSGWWMLAGLTVVGLLPLLYFWAVDGDRGDNLFGVDPKRD